VETKGKGAMSPIKYSSRGMLPYKIKEIMQEVKKSSA
jgi:hypothetical protein